MSNEQLREALQRIQYKAVSLADAQVIALEALALPATPPAAAPASAVPQGEPVALTERKIGDCIDKTNRESQYGHHHFGWSKDLAANIIAALQSSADVRDVSKPDMFWNNDDPEKQFDSIDEMLNDLLNQGAEPEVGSVFEVQRGIRLPNIKVIVTSVDENAGEFEYEEIDAAIRAHEAIDLIRAVERAHGIGKDGVEGDV